MRDPAPCLRDWLAEFQARGASFDRAWAMVMPRVCRGRADEEVWLAWFEQTRESWRRAYLREPPASADLAMLTLLELVTGENTAPDPEDTCEWCGDPLPLDRPSHKRFCCDAHRRMATRRREGQHRRLARSAEGAPEGPQSPPPRALAASSASIERQEAIT
jgi:hypothetical protein